MSFQERLEQVYEELQSENDVEKLVLPNPSIEVTTTNKYDLKKNIQNLENECILNCVELIENNKLFKRE